MKRLKSLYLKRHRSLCNINPKKIKKLYRQRYKSLDNTNKINPSFFIYGSEGKRLKEGTGPRCK